MMIVKMFTKKSDAKTEKLSSNYPRSSQPINIVSKSDPVAPNVKLPRYKCLLSYYKRNRLLKWGIIPLLAIITIFYHFLSITQGGGRVPIQAPSSQTPTRPPKPINPVSELANINFVRIAFVQNNDLFVADKSGLKQIVAGHNIGRMRWSTDGRYLGWIENEEFTLSNINGSWEEVIGVAVYAYDLNQDQLIELVSPIEVTNSPPDKPSKYEIFSFDFFSLSPLKILYARGEGVWLKDINNGKESLVLKNDLGSKEDFLDYHNYYGIEMNFSGNLILVEEGGYEWNAYSIFNRSFQLVKKLWKVNDYGSLFWWGHDEKTLCGYGSAGMYSGGIGEISITSETSKEITSADVVEVEISSIGQIAASIPNNANFSDEGESLYLVQPNGELKLLKSGKKIANIRWIPDIEKIIYLNEGNLYSINIDGSNETLLLEGISGFEIR